MHQEVKNEQELKAAVAEGLSIVDFWATWCGPCMMMGERIAAEVEPNRPDVKIVKVNVDEAPELAAAFGVMSIPALFCYKDGVQKAAFVGVTDTRELLAAFN